MEEMTACPRCRHANPAENRFCGACGGALEEGAQLVRRSDVPAATRRALLRAELAPVGRTLAVGLAALAAQAGLAWLRRRAEVAGRPALPPAAAAGRAKTGPPTYWSFEEVHAWLRDGDVERRILAQRVVRSLGAPDTSRRRGADD